MQPSQAVVRDGIYVTATMFDRYAPGIIGIIFQGMDDKTAIDLCEEGMEDHVRSLLAELVGESGEDPKAVLAKLAARLGRTQDATRSGDEAPFEDDSEGSDEPDESVLDDESED